MKELGRILEISGKKITIKGGEIGGCFGCMSQECKVNGKILSAENRQDLPLQIGQTVEIDNPTATTVGQGIAVLAPPLLAFVAGYVIVMLRFPQSGDEIRAAVGVAAMLLGFFAVYWIRKLIPDTGAPQVVRIVDENRSEL